MLENIGSGGGVEIQCVANCTRIESVFRRNHKLQRSKTTIARTVAIGSCDSNRPGLRSRSKIRTPLVSPSILKRFDWLKSI